MKDLLLKKIKILKKAAQGTELFDLDFCGIVLMKPTNSPSDTEPFICDVEAKIRNRVSEESHRDFYKNLNKINEEIEKYKLSCIVDF